MPTGRVFLVLVPSIALAQSYTIAPFDFPGAIATVAARINNSGQVLGAYTDSTNTSHCFVRSPDGVFTTLTNPPGAMPGTVTCSGLNNLRQSVGSFSDAQGIHGYSRDPSGNFTTFDLPGPTGPGADAAAINDRGEITGPLAAPPNGSSGYLRAADGTFTILQNLAIGEIAPTAINNQDEIAGWVLNGSSEGTQHGFIRTPDGAYTKFDVPGTTTSTRINALNNAGQFAGNLVGGPGFICQPDGAFTLLNVNMLNGINDSGEVAGSTFDGKTHGFIGTPGSIPPQPAIRTLLPGVMPASAYGSAVVSNANTTAPGTWIEIYGQNLASTTRSWRDRDFQSGVAPTMLDGVAVSIGGTSAFISYVSPGQVNALVPSTIATGMTSLTVTNGALSGTPVNVTVVPSQPGMLTVPPLNDPQSVNIAAVFPDFVTYALPSIPAYSNAPTRTPRPGDTIVLFGIGFGPVTPDVPMGRIATQPTSLDASVQIAFSSASGSPVPATVTYAGLVLTTVGLYQFNVVVPDVPAAANVGVSVSVNGAVLGGRRLLIPVGN
jgi:uncharacterized protein (TIGR03437 family)